MECGFNLSPLIASFPLLGERVTGPILFGTVGIVAGTILLSPSVKSVGFRPKHLIYPLLTASSGGTGLISWEFPCSRA